MQVRRLALASVVLLLCGCAQQGMAPGGGVAARLEAARHSPPQLRALLYRMPKGGDLHSHLSGAAYAEALIDAGAASGKCVDAQHRLAACGRAKRALVEALTDSDFRTALIAAWSMRGFVPSSGVTGHDHFFATFGRFGGAAGTGEMAAEVVDRAGMQRQRYVELMLSFQSRAVTALGSRLPWNGDLADFHRRLMAAGLPALLPQARQDLAQGEAQMRALQRCNTPQASPGCAVTVRWLGQVTRSNPPGAVFAQMLFTALLSEADPHVVGLNFVGPEDGPQALTNYSLHMRMLDYLHGVMPRTNVALHAGELTLGLVPPDALRFHVREAVDVAHAKRIGHGVDVMYEAGAAELLRRMADRRVAVEINLTSNDQILGVRGAAHPFPVYRAAGVPTVLSTDDEGVERIDRTHELQRAVTEFGLDWPTLIALERNTLEYAFVPGASLWADPVAWRKVAACDGAEQTPCEAFLQGSEKARLQWQLERDLAAFEHE